MFQKSRGEHHFTCEMRPLVATNKTQGSFSKVDTGLGTKVTSSRSSVAVVLVYISALVFCGGSGSSP